jgi:ERCC4-related helicase
MAPTVVLVDQQLERIMEQMPNVICKRLCGDDNVDTWSSQGIWDAFLENVRIVVSTPDVLLDALKHGFVSITSLSLIVFDEG